MKRNNGYMAPKLERERKTKYTCADCGKLLAPAEAYCYVDPNNYAITKNAKPYCLDCYKRRYKD